jgi:hypothetical protein
MMMTRLRRYGLPALLTLTLLPALAAETVQRFEPESMQQIIARHQGKPFVLMLWSLDCVYCKASLKTLSEESKRRKLEIVTIAIDPAADPQALTQMRQRLAQAGLHGNAWAFGEAPPEQLRYAIDPNWYGELPRSYWFDGQGARTAYSGAIKRETLERLLPQR